MQHIQPGIAAPIFAGLIVVVLSQKWLRDAILEGLNNFRGGPPTSMHPSPSDDRFLLCRKADRHPRRTG